jgi:putative membrane protein
MSVGPLTLLMGTHILMMNVAAPALALALGRMMSIPADSGAALAAPTCLQIALLWLWHAPGVMSGAHLPAAHAAMQASLFAAALWFWLAVWSQIGSARWRSLFALLVTGKLFCLLGALLVFAPRLLDAGHAPISSDAATIEDQQIAGLLMLAACPLTYVLAGIVISARWIGELAAADAVSK